jgi:hypothetical protein
VGFRAALTGTPATGDKWRMVPVPKGARMLSLVISNADLGTSAPGDVGWETSDADAFIDDHAFGTASTGTAAAAAAIAGQTATTAADYLSITFGTISSGASGAVTATGAWFVP